MRAASHTTAALIVRSLESLELELNDNPDSFTADEQKERITERYELQTDAEARLTQLETEHAKSPHTFEHRELTFADFADVASGGVLRAFVRPLPLAICTSHPSGSFT